jgi:hypothetical protein
MPTDWQLPGFGTKLLGQETILYDLQSGSLMKLAQTFTTTQKQMCVDEFGDEQKCGDAVIGGPERENKL